MFFRSESTPLPHRKASQIVAGATATVIASRRRSNPLFYCIMLNISHRVILNLFQDPPLLSVIASPWGEAIYDYNIHENFKICRFFLLNY